MTQGRMHGKYKAYTVARRIFICLTIAFCLAPVIFAAICILPEIKDAGEAWMLSGGVVSTLAVVVFLLRAVLKSGSSRLPWSITVFISVLLLFLLALALKAVLWYAVGTLGIVSGESSFILDAFGLVEDAYCYLIVQAVGAAVSVICELASKYCKSMLEEIKLFYLNDGGEG